MENNNASANNLEYKKMKMNATSLFILMVVIFLVSHLFINQLSILPYINAFAEAAMIGTLADWFAVVALFRKPLGFPYHTAIIPNNKDRMGESLGKLVQENFLTPENIMEEFKDIDLVKEGLRLLKTKQDDLLQYIYKLIPEILNHLDKEEIKEMIIKKISEIKFTKVISDILELLTNENRHQDLLDLTLNEIKKTVVQNREKIIEMIRNHDVDITWWIPNFKVPKRLAKYIANALIAWFESEFTDIKQDPFHVIRKKFNQIVSNLGNELKENKELQETIDEKIRSVFLNKAVTKYFDSVWKELKENIESDLESTDSRIKKWINTSFNSLINYIETNEELGREIDADVKEFIKEILIEEKDRISKMISDKVKETPKEQVSDLIESYVGKDLQYIRINGTIVGGLVGLLIFLVTKVI